MDYRYLYLPITVRNAARPDNCGLTRGLHVRGIRYSNNNICDIGLRVDVFII